MNNTIKFTLICSFLLTITTGINAETEIKVSGQVRIRGELDKKIFFPDARTYEFNKLRTRVGIEAIIDSNTHAFVQFQDSRTLGGLTSFGEPASGSLNDGKNVYTPGFYSS